MMIMRGGRSTGSKDIPMADHLRDKLERQKNAVEASLKIRGSQDLGGRVYQRELGNKDDAFKRLKTLKGIIRRDDDSRDYSEGERANMWQEADRLREEFRRGMPTRAEMHPAHVNLATQKPYIDEQAVNLTVQRNLSWLKRNDKKTLEFKRLMRLLAPDRPELANIEYHRPTGQQTSKAVVMEGGKK